MTIEAGLRALLGHGSPGAALQDADGRYVFVTRDFEDAHGLAAGTMLGASDAELLPPAAVSARAAASHEARAGGRAPFEYALDGAGIVSGDVVDLAPETDGTACFGVVLRTIDHADGHRRRLLVDMVAAQEHERRRIAGEIHDDAVQAMSAVALRAEQLAGSLDSVAAVQLHRLRDVIRDATGRLRRLLIQLQPPALDTAIGPAIEAYVTSSSLPFDHVLDDQLGQEPSREMRVVLYRIAQEALRNAAKHACATTVRTELADTGATVRLTVTDDGEGVREEILRRSQPGHLGVDTMRYRAELAGGRCTITSTPGAGTTVTVEFPRAKDGER